MFKRAVEGMSVSIASRYQAPRIPVFLSVVLLALAASQAHAWTTYYDGFAYEPPSTDTGSGAAGYRLPQSSPNGDGITTEYPYHVGDTRYYNNVNTPRPLLTAPFNYVYSPSAWVTSDSGSSVGYWPFISPGYSGIDDPAGFTYPGLPAPTGHVVVCFGSANNNGKSSRVSFINLNQTPPTGPFRAIVRGTLYYSMLLKVIEAPHAITATLGAGFFHAGFNDLAPDSSLPNSTTATPAVSRACARLRLRAGGLVAADDNKFQIGVESDTGTANTIVWDTNNTYNSGVSMTPILVVASYEFVNGTTTDDISRMWVNPDQSTLGAASAPTYTTNGTSFPLTSTGGDINQNQIRSFFIRQGGNAQGTVGGVTRVVFDELRIGTSWADVTSNVACVTPTVSSVSPAYGAKNTTLSAVAIVGTNFVQGVTLVKLTKPSEPDIVATAVDVSDSAHLTCTFTIPSSAVLGTRDVVVTTCPDSPATLSNAFHVVCGSAADFNCDGFVDGVDLVSFFETCAAPGSSGAGVPFATGCDAEDLDHDGDVDMNDFGIFQRCYSGTAAANPSCGY